MAEKDAKTKVLILGGCGFVGRSIGFHILEEGLATNICLVDKLSPVLFKLTEKEKELIGKMEFRSGNLSREDVAEKCFEGEWDIVINAAAETRYAQVEGVYKERITQVAVNCAKIAVKHGCKRFIQVRILNKIIENSEFFPALHSMYVFINNRISGFSIL